MKLRIQWDDTYETPYLIIPDEVLTAIGWKVGNVVSLDIPCTGGGLRIYKEGDTINLMGGVKEVING